MRRAVLGYHASGNLGDALQSYAMLRLLGTDHPVSVVDREDIGGFTPSEATVLVMNGWLLHRPDRFFFSPNVIPAMVGVHLAPKFPLYSRYPPFADIVRECPSVREVFRQAAPVGARDLYTLAALRRSGIDSYFAGCPTLTLRPKGIAPDGSIVAIDVPEPICSVLEQRLGQPFVRVSNTSDSSWTEVSEIYDCIEPHLELLERAELVITTRLHAALPARALGVHTVFAPADPSDPRLSGLTDFLPVVVSLQNLESRPLSLFRAGRWESARDINQQAVTIRRAVGAALHPSEARLRPEIVERDRLLTELERAALAYDRIRLWDRRRRLRDSRLWRYSAPLRRL